MNPVLSELRKPPLLWLMVFANVSRGEVGETSWRIGVAPVALAVANGGRSVWFVGAMILMVYGIFALTLVLLPPPS